MLHGPVPAFPSQSGHCQGQVLDKMVPDTMPGPGCSREGLGAMRSIRNPAETLQQLPQLPSTDPALSWLPDTSGIEIQGSGAQVR